jgi:hypothetical protein
LKIRHLSIALWLVPVLFVGGPLVVASCTGGENTETGPCHDGTIVLLECEPVDGSIADRFTDEACAALDTAETRMTPTPSDSQAPAIDAPTEGATLPNASPFTFTWHPQGFAFRIEPSPAFRAFEWRDDVARWTTLLPAAEAHCAPFGGVAYALVFRADNQQILRLETANTSWTPEDADWTRLRAARGTISLSIEAARFSNNEVTEGPVVSATPRTFTIAP